MGSLSNELPSITSTPVPDRGNGAAACGVLVSVGYVLVQEAKLAGTRTPYL